MDKFMIVGGRRLFGSVKAECAKNAVLPLLAAAVLTDERVVIHKCPRIADVLNMVGILGELGCNTKFDGNDLVIDSADAANHEIPSSLAKELRSSVFMLGSVVSRFGRARIAYPGGCDIGLRPIDLHLSGLRRLGVQINEEGGYIDCVCSRLTGAEIVLDCPSVGATENIMLAAVRAGADMVAPSSMMDGVVAAIREELARIGPVNLLAIEEHRALEERHAFHQAQADDLTRSRETLLNLIRTINETSGRMFRETFAQADANFRAMFTRLFNGGEARLVLLENAEDPLECGIDIIARPPGKRPQTISLLSGGERTMTAVALLFAIFLIKPAPFCLLDELDAALDDSNIGRFVDALKDFLTHSQFLIITHNQHTIAGSDIVYGVTMPEKGVSRTLSMRFSRQA